MKKLLNILIILLATGPFATAQLSNLEKANQEFEIKNYTQAIKLYQKELDKDNSSTNISSLLLKIGQSFKEINQYTEAIEYYKRFIEIDSDVHKNVLIEYADLLLKTDNVYKAKEIYEKLLKNYPGDKKVEKMIANCQFAIAEKQKTELPRIKNQSEINSKESEFGLGFFNEQLIFASQRLEDNYSSIQSRTNQGLSDLYSADYNIDLEMFTNAKRLVGSINTEFNEGTFVYQNATNTAYFTQCEGTPEKCRIVKAKHIKKKWVDSEEVKFKQPEYNYAHPSLTNNGRTMYFTSDLPGGVGEKDIWKASITENGFMGNPQNLGALVNTEGDELFPFIIGDSILMFVSDGHVGIGGLDIFYSKIVNGLPEKPINVGAPINSTADDFSILVNDNLLGGYFCSNRFNEEQSDDIFAFFHNIFLNDIFGRVVDSMSFEPLVNAKITYCTNEVPVKVVYTDSLGNFTVPSSAHANCSNKHLIKVEKDGFVNRFAEVPCYSQKEIIILMKNTSTRYHRISGIVRNKSTRLPIENAKIRLKSLKGINDSTFTNSSGQYLINRVTAFDYIILRSSAPNYLIDSKSFKTPENYDNVLISRENGFDTDFELIPIELDTDNDGNPTDPNSGNSKTTFRIQIAATGNKVDVSSKFKNLSALIKEYGIFVETVNNLNKYQVGNFSSKNDAVEVQRLILGKGFADSFIVVVKNKTGIE